MPVELTMPQLSDTMTEGTVVKWLKKEGDKVKEGEIIAEVETDKATMEWESTDNGTIAKIVVKEGDKVKVGGTIAVLATAGEDASKVQASSTTTKTEARASEPQAVSSDEQRRESGNVATAAAPAPPRGNGSQERIRISPLARRIAEERGIDPATIKGTGPGGRIVQEDILALGEPRTAREVEAPAKPQAAAAAPARMGSGEKHIIPLNKMRQTIALRLQQSKQQIPHFYETVDVEMESVSAAREKLNARLSKEGVKLSISDFINKAIAEALILHPAVNAHFSGQKNEITRFGDVHLGIAVAIPDGLIVPVLRNINQMGVKEIRQRSLDLAERARAGRLKQDELSGATFTVSTLGNYGIREFSAIINPPEVGILAVGAAEKRAVVRDGGIVPRLMMSATLSVDHRAVDGATAADFLRTFKDLLEAPAMMLA